MRKRKTMIATGVEQGGACADASNVSLSHATGGRVPDCNMAKAVHLCEKDPLTAAKLCPVSCALGCGAPHGLQIRRTLFGTIENPRCSTASFHGRMMDVQKSCCEGTTTCVGIPTDCSYKCSKVASLFYTDCKQILAKLAPTKTHSIATLVQTCERIPTRAVINAINGANCSKPRPQRSPDAK